MSKFMIVAKCDPYHARWHYNKEPVLKYDGPTPVKWIMSEGYEDEGEAKDALMLFAKSCKDYERGPWRYEDNESVAYDKAFILEETGEEDDMSWYQGPGIYNCESHEPVLLEGGWYFEDDTMTYSVEEKED